MPQFGRPQRDITTNGWTTEGGSPDNISASVDDTSDTDYVVSPNEALDSTVEFGLAPLLDPETALSHVVRYRVGRAGPDPVVIDAELLQGVTKITGWSTENLLTTPTTIAQPLTTAQADAISDYTDLRLRLTSSVEYPLLTIPTKIRSGSFIDITLIFPSGFATSVAPGVNVLYSQLIYVPWEQSYDAFCINVATPIAATNVHVGLYTFGPNGYPTDRLEYATISTAAAGNITQLFASGTPRILAPGWYYLAFVTSSAAIRIATVNTLPLFQGVHSGWAQSNVAFFASFTAAVPPLVFPTLTGTPPTLSAYVPRIGLRAA